MAPLQPNNKCLTSVATGECMCVAKARADLRVGPGGPGLPFCPGIFFFRKRVSDVQYGIQAFAKFNLQNALDCISENLNLKNFPGRECARNSQKSAPFVVLMSAITPILPLCTISLGPLYHKILRPPLWKSECYLIAQSLSRILYFR